MKKNIMIVIVTLMGLMTPAFSADLESNRVTDKKFFEKLKAEFEATRTPFSPMPVVVDDVNGNAYSRTCVNVTDGGVVTEIKDNLILRAVATGIENGKIKTNIFLLPATREDLRTVLDEGAEIKGGVLDLNTITIWFDPICPESANSLQEYIDVVYSRLSKDGSAYEFGTDCKKGEAVQSFKRRGSRIIYKNLDTTLEKPTVAYGYCY